MATPSRSPHRRSTRSFNDEHRHHNGGIAIQFEKLSTTAIITVSASDVFAPADPSSHADIDGTGWVGRCLTTLPNRAEVTPTYDWSEVLAEVRRQIQSPPSDEQHLDDSLERSARLAKGSH